MSDTPDTFAAYAADRDDPRFTDWLRDRSEPDWSAAVDGRFVRELGDGTIPDPVFRRYLERDYAFVETLTGTFGHALGDGSTPCSGGRSNWSGPFSRRRTGTTGTGRDRSDVQSASSSPDRSSSAASESGC